MGVGGDESISARMVGVSWLFSIRQKQELEAFDRAFSPLFLFSSISGKVQSINGNSNRFESWKKGAKCRTTRVTEFGPSLE